jgi:hypothetical protein
VRDPDVAVTAFRQVSEFGSALYMPTGSPASSATESVDLTEAAALAENLTHCPDVPITVALAR